MGIIRKSIVAASLLSSVLLPSQLLAANPRPLDLSKCGDDGGWVVCPQIAPNPHKLILSHEQFDALKKATPLNQTQIDQAVKTLQDK